MTELSFRIILVIACLLGCAFGLGLYTFVYGKGHSYFTNNPEACANCHIMQPQFDAWQTSSHHAVAVCNDCHTPHNIVGKYAIKAINGFQHSWAFTTQIFHEPIQIKSYNRAVTEGTCRDCHGQMWDAAGIPEHATEDMSCIRCHGSVGHR